MLTPSSLSVKPNVKHIQVPDYDFDGQFRWHQPLMAGSYTSATVQTFDSQGKPTDSVADNNDA
jgi:hypothetical protein